MTTDTIHQPRENRAAALPSAGRGQEFSGLDLVSIIAAIIMALGPLTAYALGL